MKHLVTVRAAWAAQVMVSCVVVSGCGAPAVPVTPSMAATAAPARRSLAVVPGDLVIRDVTVVPMSTTSGNGEIAHQTVVIRGGKIAAVAPRAEIAVPPAIQVQVIDGTGKWLMPGLADMHVHVWSDDQLAMMVAAGVTTVRIMFGSELTLDMRARTARGELFGPTIVTAGPIIDGDPPIWPSSTVLADPADAERIVREQKAAGYDFLKAYTRLSRPAYEALAAAARRQGMVIAGHVPDAVGLLGVLAAHQRSVEHLDGWLLALGAPAPEGASRKAQMQFALDHLDMAKLPGLITQTLTAGTWNCPTLIVLDRFAALDDVPAAKRRAKWLAKLPASLVESWDPKRDFRLTSFTSSDYVRIRAENTVLAKVLAQLSVAGAPILVGTDTGNPYVIPGESMHDEIELMVTAGVSRAQVLRAATAEAARYLGTPGAFGVVEPGARADLILSDHDPLTGPLPLVPDGVVLRGAWQPRAVLEEKLADIEHRAAPPTEQDLWSGIAPLAPEGGAVTRAVYDVTLSGAAIGQERLAIGRAHGERVIVGQQVANYGIRVETSYRIARGEASVAARFSGKSVELTGKIAGAALHTTGSDATGKPVTLDAPVPRGAVLVGPGTSWAGSWVSIAEPLAKLKVGEHRTLATLALAYFPATAIQPASYDIERRPGSGDQRRFAVTVHEGAQSVTGELALDAAGGLVSLTLGPPFNLGLARK